MQSTPSVLRANRQASRMFLAILIIKASFGGFCMFTLEARAVIPVGLQAEVSVCLLLNVVHSTSSSYILIIFEHIRS